MARQVNMGGKSSRGKGLLGRAKEAVGKAAAHVQSFAAKAGLASSPIVDKRHHVNATTWAQTGQWVHVKSSNVEAISYDAPRKILLIEFHGGRKAPAYYAYYGVSDSKAKSLFNSTSAGKWVWRELRRKKVPYKKVG